MYLIVQLEVGELILMEGKAIYVLRCMVGATFLNLILHLSLRRLQRAAWLFDMRDGALH